MQLGKCIGCSGRIPSKKRSDARYCSATCRAAAEKRRYRERNGLTKYKPRGPYKVKRKDYESKLIALRAYSKFVQQRKVAQRPSGMSVRQEAIALGFRSGFERTLAASLQRRKTKFGYETVKLPYTVHHVYSPDFILDNGILIEAKGKLTAQDRSKMIAVKKQHPELDIRFVFMRGENKLNASSKTTYMQWAAKNGFPAADEEIPDEWLK